MRLPRDLSGEELARRLSRISYTVTRQTGSHMRLTTTNPAEHHITIPRHPALRVGTLASILDDVATHLKVTREELLARLFA
ncbi:MAG TPA: type II toxin-antitoxin system HicA family toxin [Thermoanaerobaculia bacterium]